MAGVGADHVGWSDSSARAVLQLMVESVAEMIGFEYAILSVVIGEELVTLAYYGPEQHREYLSQPDPVGIVDPIVARAEVWGPRLRYLPAGTTQDLDGHWVRFDQEHGEEPDAWNPADALLALLRDDDGSVVGVLSVDKPVTGRLPDERQRSLFERYAEQAERAVLTAVEREALLEQVTHAESARRLIRTASRPAHASLDAVLRHTHRPLVDGFGARGSWIQVFAPDGPGHGYVRTHDGTLVDLPPDIVGLAAEVAPKLWADQRALLVTPEDSAGLPPKVLDVLRERDLASFLGVGLGVGSECIGFLALSRREHQPAWSPVEIESALEIGHDLGAALVTARALERERNLVAELKQVDDYRSQLIATLSHELRTPLTVISGNLELLGGLDLDPSATRYQEAMSRGATRMGKVVDDLLLLARVSNPQHPLVRVPVDMRAVAGEVLSFVESAADAKGLALDVELDAGPLVVSGDPVELDRLLGNLVSNAVKYTPAGGRIRVSAERCHDEVVLGVADDGLGISEEDQAGLFKAFFRTNNPDALREPGTGLGLAIVATIVERHAGRVEVGSRLGEGTTFTVRLPAA